MTKRRRLIHIRPGVFIEIGKPVQCEDRSRWRLVKIDNDDVPHWEPLDPGVDPLHAVVPPQLHFRAEPRTRERGKRGETWLDR